MMERLEEKRRIPKSQAEETERSSMSKANVLNLSIPTPLLDLFQPTLPAPNLNLASCMRMYRLLVLLWMQRSSSQRGSSSKKMVVETL
jgi:hypothetical protein